MCPPSFGLPAGWPLLSPGGARAAPCRQSHVLRRCYYCRCRYCHAPQQRTPRHATAAASAAAAAQVAELLSQLPPEMDVEGLVASAMWRSRGGGGGDDDDAAAAAADGGGARRKSLDRRSLDARGRHSLEAAAADCGGGARPAGGRGNKGKGGSGGSDDASSVASSMN
jgi:hypothetical protein